jgi:membrane-bound serine protease (ClpP class)
VAGIYSEFIWPGRIIPGLLGAAALVCGVYFLWWHSPSAVGVAFIVGAGACFAVESFWNTHFLAGLLGTACLALGASTLFDKTPRITAAVAVPASIVFGAVTSFLSYAAKRARRNKWSDMEDPRSLGNFSGN